MGRRLRAKIKVGGCGTCWCNVLVFDKQIRYFMVGEYSVVYPDVVNDTTKIGIGVKTVFSDIKRVGVIFWGAGPSFLLDEYLVHIKIQAGAVPSQNQVVPTGYGGRIAFRNHISAVGDGRPEATQGLFGGSGQDLVTAVTAGLVHMFGQQTQVVVGYGRGQHGPKGNRESFRAEGAAVFYHDVIRRTIEFIGRTWAVEAVNGGFGPINDPVVLVAAFVVGVGIKGIIGHKPFIERIFWGCIRCLLAAVLFVWRWLYEGGINGRRQPVAVNVTISIGRLPTGQFLAGFRFFTINNPEIGVCATYLVAFPDQSLLGNKDRRLGRHGVGVLRLGLGIAWRRLRRRLRCRLG